VSVLPLSYAVLAGPKAQPSPGALVCARAVPDVQSPRPRSHLADSPVLRPGTEVVVGESAAAAQQVALLRAIIAALGERASPPWWRTQFLTEIGLRTVGRIVPRTAVPAAVVSTSIAARAEHDRWIGVGRRFHLFRLPGAPLATAPEALAERLLAVVPHDDPVPLQEVVRAYVLSYAWIIDVRSAGAETAATHQGEIHEHDADRW
jgi:hypothetical protein